MDLKDYEIIGEGKIAKIVSDGKYAYKVFPSWIPKEYIVKEVKVLKEIKEHTNLNMVECELLEDERILRMTLIKGNTLAHKMRKEKFQLGVETLIQSQIEVYKYHDLKLEDAFVSFETQLSTSHLDKNIKVKALESLYSIPRQQSLCHFDIHFENIMMQDNKSIIIDWSNAKLGHPSMDIARSYIIMLQYVKRKANIYLSSICREMNYQVEDVLKVVPLMAALRMLERDTLPFHDQLMKLIFEDEH
jgi:thiamine kinase-like enzyme